MEGYRDSGSSLCFRGPFHARHAADREALLLVLICALDMYTTLWWVATGHATEANPLLAPTFEARPLAFVLTKSVLCLPSILLATHLARRHPHFTAWLLRAVTAAYVLIYLVAIP